MSWVTVVLAAASLTAEKFAEMLVLRMQPNSEPVCQELSTCHELTRTT